VARFRGNFAQAQKRDEANWMKLKKKCLFLSTHSPFNDKIKAPSVGLTKVNFKVMSKLFCTEAVWSLPETTTLVHKGLRFFWLLFGYMGGDSPSFRRRLKKTLLKFKPDIVYVNNAPLGPCAKLIKKVNSRTQVVVQFHDIGTEYYEQSAGYSGPLKALLKRGVAQSDRAACESADLIVTLTPADSEGLMRLYGRSASRVIPTAVPVKSPLENLQGIPVETPYVLFCGSYWAPNIEAVRWLVQKVADHIDYDLWIVGYQMENLTSEVHHPKVKILGTVDDVAPYYQSAVAVLCPNFRGAGINTKAVATFAYGKMMLANAFALRGLPEPLPPTVLRCEDEQDFIWTLAHLKDHPRNTQQSSQEARAYYEHFFSETAKLKAYQDLLGV
jgi:polysaccharide biosynthesis protein PslH